MKRSRLLCCAAVCLLLLSGCSGLFSDGGDVDPVAVGERVDERLSSVSSLEMTMTQTIETGNESRTVTARVLYERPDKFNVTYLSGPAGAARVVSNGSAIWSYNESRNEVWIDSEAETPTLRDLLLGTARLGSNATFEGNETLSGEDAVKLSYAVQDTEMSMVLAGGQDTSRLADSMANGSVRTRVWLDTDVWLPRKVHIENTAYSENSTITTRYEEFRINRGVPDARFAFDPPEDATITDRSRGRFRPPRNNTTSFETYAAVAANATVPVPDPTIPAAFSFREGITFDHSELRGVELTYRDDTRQIEVVSVTDGGPFFDQGETVPVGDVEGTYVELSNDRIVQWQCGETLYVVSGGTDRETLLEIARSVGCR